MKEEKKNKEKIFNCLNFREWLYIPANFTSLQSQSADMVQSVHQKSASCPVSEASMKANRSKKKNQFSVLVPSSSMCVRNKLKRTYFPHPLPV